MFVCVDCHLIELQKYNLFVRNVRSGFIFCTFGWRVNELTRKFPLRVVLKILFLEFCYSDSAQIPISELLEPPLKTCPLTCLLVNSLTKKNEGGSK